MIGPHSRFLGTKKIPSISLDQRINLEWWEMRDNQFSIPGDLVPIPHLAPYTSKIA